MAILKYRTRPGPWLRHRERAKYAWLVPLFAIEWVWVWLAYWLSGWAFLEVLEYLGTLSLLLAVISYFSESGDRIKQKHYQAWQVINSAQAKGGSGGRIEALEQLHADGVPLVGVDVSGAFLQGIDLSGANLLRANLHAADVRGGHFMGAQMEYADLGSANFRDSTLQKADLRHSTLQDADLTGANLSDTDLEGTDLSKADLRNADFRNAKWQKITDVKLANVFGIKNAPADFLNWAMQNGAVSTETDTE
jgi:hypothetical protein